VSIGKHGASLDGVGCVLDLVELLVLRLEAFEDFLRLFERRLEHLDLLKAAGQRAVALQVAAVLLERGRHVLVHRCLRCGIERRCRTSDGDDIDAMVEIVRARGGGY